MHVSNSPDERERNPGPTEGSTPVFALLAKMTYLENPTAPSLFRHAARRGLSAPATRTWRRSRLSTLGWGCTGSALISISAFRGCSPDCSAPRPIWIASGQRGPAPQGPPPRRPPRGATGRKVGVRASAQQASSPDEHQRNPGAAARSAPDFASFIRATLYCYALLRSTLAFSQSINRKRTYTDHLVFRRPARASRELRAHLTCRRGNGRSQTRSRWCTFGEPRCGVR